MSVSPGIVRFAAVNFDSQSTVKCIIYRFNLQNSCPSHFSLKDSLGNGGRTKSFVGEGRCDAGVASSGSANMSCDGSQTAPEDSHSVSA